MSLWRTLSTLSTTGKTIVSVVTVINRNVSHPFLSSFSIFTGASSPGNIYASSFLAVQANVEFYGMNLFARNNVTAVMFETANMFVGGKITFRENIGQQGGGLRIRMVSQVGQASRSLYL